jgi:hypothetical protein
MNVGIATGERSGFFALDEDLKSGGPASLAALPRLPETLTAATGSGGHHYLFAHVRGLGNRAGLAPGLDVRGDGGQIVAAPSRHWSGGTYRWLDPAAPIAPAPAWMIEALGRSEARASTRAPDHWRNLWAAGAAEGARNDAVARMAGYLIARRLDPLMVLDVMLSWNASRIRPPLPDREVEATVDSIAGREARRLRRRLRGDR